MPLYIKVRLEQVSIRPSVLKEHTDSYVVHPQKESGNAVGRALLIANVRLLVAKPYISFIH